MKYEYREAPEGINNPPVSHLKEALVLAGGLAVIVVGAFLALGWCAGWLVDRVSPETERRLAALVRATGERGAAKPGEQKLQSLLDTLAPRLPALAYPLRIEVDCADRVNAVALPGGKIVIYAGLLSRIRSENELAMVIGHEAGHFAARDHLRVLGRALVVLALWAFLFRGQDRAPSFIQNLVGVTSDGYSRAQEEAADRVGAHLVNGQYGHAGGIVDFFKTLEKEDHQSAVGAWFSTHPAHLKRVESLEGLIADEGWTLEGVKPLDGKEWVGRICTR